MEKTVRRRLPEVLVGERGHGGLDGVTAGELGAGKAGERLHAPLALGLLPLQLHPTASKLVTPEQLEETQRSADIFKLRICP